MATNTTGSVTSGAGIDVQTLVSQLMSVERRPIDKLNTKETTYQAKISALGLVKSNIANFQGAAKALTNSGSSNLMSYKASPSDATVLSASTSKTAALGSYAINVSTLAQSQKLVAAGQASSTATIGDGSATTVTFDFGKIEFDPAAGGALNNGIYTNATFTGNGSTAQSITIDSSNNTLEGIRDAINNAKLGVTASIINDGGSTPYRLALSSSNTGVSNSIKISTSGGDGSISNLLSYDPAGTQNLTQTMAAQNAQFTVDGVAISKNSNTVSDAIEGVSLTLSKTTSTAITLNVTQDNSAINEKINNFVKAYNDLYTALKNASAYKSKSALEGDSTMRSFMQQIRGIASGSVTGGTMSNFFEVGITFNASGSMQFDSSKLSSAISKDASDVANLFGGSTGFATKFTEWSDSVLEPGGTMAQKTDRINDAIKLISDQRTVLEARMSALQTRYTTMYSNLNVTLNSMNQTSTYLSQQLSKL